jgi:hypothetical protein
VALRLLALRVLPEALEALVQLIAIAAHLSHILKVEMAVEAVTELPIQAMAEMGQLRLRLLVVQGLLFFDMQIQTQMLLQQLARLPIQIRVGIKSTSSLAAGV